MVQANVREAIRALFLQGRSIRWLANDFGVSRSTIERWSVREGWVRERSQTMKRIRDDYSKQLSIKMNERRDNISGKILDHLKAIQLELELYRMGKIRRQDRLFSLRDLRNCADAMHRLLEADLVGIRNLERLIQKSI